jgi:hypothetical protein
MLNKMIDGMYIDGMYVSIIDGVPINVMHNVMTGQKRKIGKGYVPGTISKNEEPTKKRRV